MKLKITIILTIIVIVCLSGCKKDHKTEETVGEITSTEVINIGSNYVELLVSYGYYSSSEFNNLVKGVCYSETNTSPTVKDNVKKVDYANMVRFDNLKEATTYYWRAYIQKEDIIVYGDAKSFKTLKLPEVSTLVATDITITSATLGGNIKSVGTPEYTSKGICYSSTSQNPTIYDSSITVSGSGTGNYTGTTNSLSANTTYYYRAYVTNSAGTAYGEQKSFTTNDATLPALSTLAVTNITEYSATLRGNISNVGNPPYSEKGICFSTSQNPTIYNSYVTVSGSGTGNFEGGYYYFSSNTTYYVRAFATNAAGTAYGNQVSFKTKNPQPTTAQVRFRKVLDYLYVTEMSVDYVSGGELASYYFGTNSGTSPYYEIPPGQHVPWYYYTYPGYENWYHCLSNSSNDTYNFQEGYKYTVVCDDDGAYLIFYVTNDGSSKSSVYNPPVENPTTIIKVPKKQGTQLNGKPRADVR